MSFVFFNSSVCPSYSARTWGATCHTAVGRSDTPRKGIITSEVRVGSMAGLREFPTDDASGQTVIPLSGVVAKWETANGTDRAR